MEHVGQLTNLKQLSVTLSVTPRITDAGIAHIANLTNLEGLYLQGNQKITDASMEHIRKFTQLKHLNLIGTGVTDASVDLLKELPNLEWVNLGNTKVSEAKKAEMAEFCEKNKARIEKARQEPLPTSSHGDTEVYNTTSPHSEIGYSTIIAGMPSVKSVPPK